MENCKNCHFLLQLACGNGAILVILFKKIGQFFSKNHKKYKTIKKIDKNKYYHQYLNFDMCFEKKSEIFLEIFFQNVFQIFVNFQNSSETRMTVTLAVTVTVTGNFGVRNSPRLLPTYIRTQEKFETGRHVNHLLTDAPISWGYPKSGTSKKALF